MTRWLVLLAKLCLSALLLGWLFHATDVQWLQRALAQLRAAPLILGALLLCLQAGLLAWRWQRLVHHLGGHLTLVQALRLLFIGLFFNQALPSSVGGDAFRIWHLHRLGSAPGVAFSSVALERVTGLVLMGLQIAVCLPWVWSSLQSDTLRWALSAVAPVLLISLAAVATADRWAGRWLPGRAGAAVSSLGTGLRRLASDGRAALEVSLLGVAASLLAVVVAWVIGQALGIDASFATYVVVVQGAALFSILPVSVGGWGLRELGIVTLFGAFSVAAEQALALSIVCGLLPLLVSLPGGVLWWGGPRGRPATDALAGTPPVAPVDAATTLPSTPPQRARQDCPPVPAPSAAAHASQSPIP